MFKAAVNGPNRRRNRVGDATVASNPETTSSATFSEQGIPFRVEALEKAPTHIQSKLNGQHACLVACGGPSGQALLQRHKEQTDNDSSDVILIHFHEVPVLILRVLLLQDESNDVLYLSEVHRHTHKVCEDTTYNVTCCSRPSGRDGYRYDALSAVLVEVSLRHHSDEDDDPIQVPSAAIIKQLMSCTYQSILTTNELILVEEDEVELVCRIAEVRIHADGEEAVLSLEDATMDDPFRGQVIVDTEFFVSVSGGSSSALEISGEKKRPFPKGKMPSDVVHVTTRDGEWFPVRRLLLAPCLQLTRYVQAGRGKYKNEIPTLSDEVRSEDAPTDDGRPHCKVDIDCHVFDRVLLYLTSLAYPQNKFVPELSENTALADAADFLGIESLSDLCRKQVSTFDSRVRRNSYIPFSEVKLRNEIGGELLLIIDGMVLDITRWIDEHPGGPTIIPTQALNVDATVFFELYHVSRQSFVYLKSFYIGELRPEDYAQLLESSDSNARATDGFLQSLRSFTKEWRVQISQGEAEKIHKSL